MSVTAASGNAVIAVADSPLVSIGGSEATSLFEVTGAVRLSNGDVVIANNGTADLRWYDGEGNLVRTVGRKGSGPGEFRTIYSIASVADTIFAFDLRLLRVSRFSPDGELLGSTRLEPPAGTTTPMFVGPGDDGSLIAYVTKPVTRSGGGAALHRDSVLLLRYARDGRLLDTLGAYRGAESVSRTQTVGGRTLTLMSSYDFYQGFVAAAGASSDGARFVIAAGATDSAVIDRIDGAAATRVTWDAPVVPFDESYIEALMDRERAESSNPEALRRAAEVYDALPRPSSLPVFRAVVIGVDGRVWVRAMSPGGASAAETWWVFPASSQATPSRLSLKPGEHLLSAGRDHVVVVATDSLDVEHVRVLAVDGAR